MFERYHQKLLPIPAFRRRVVRHVALGAAIIAVSLLLGSAGYHFFAGLGWIDALLNASMILTGMGPVDRMETTGGKLFATFYAIYSGVIFLTVMAIVLAPLYHRFLHQFHVDEKDK